MLSSLAQMAGLAPPPLPDTFVQLVRIPADGSPTHLLKLKTIPIKSENNVDLFLAHVPDLRPYWGFREGWRRRAIGSFMARGQAPAALDGFYLCFKNFVRDGDRPLRGASGRRFRGDLFVVKTASREWDEADEWERYDEHGRVIYEDILPAFLGSPLVERARERLGEIELDPAAVEMLGDRWYWWWRWLGEMLPE